MNSVETGTWSRRRAVWCEPGWRCAAPPLLLSPLERSCWSAELNGAPGTRCTAHTAWGGLTSPLPECKKKIHFCQLKPKRNFYSSIYKPQKLHNTTTEKDLWDNTLWNNLKTWLKLKRLIPSDLKKSHKIIFFFQELIRQKVYLSVCERESSCSTTETPLRMCSTD